jgi:hypothetical protein
VQAGEDPDAGHAVLMNGQWSLRRMSWRRCCRTVANLQALRAIRAVDGGARSGCGADDVEARCWTRPSAARGRKPAASAAAAPAAAGAGSGAGTSSLRPIMSMLSTAAIVFSGASGSSV